MQAGPTSRDDRDLAVIAHLLGIFFPIVGPVILYLIAQPGSFGKQESAEALNFNITLVLINVAALLLACPIGLVTAGIGLFFVIPPVILIGVAALVLGILACLAASRGEGYRYPLTLRLIQG